MSIPRTRWIFLFFSILMFSCEKDLVNKYEGNYTFTSTIRDANHGDTVTQYLGSVSKIDNTSLRINFGPPSLSYAFTSVDVEVDQDGNLTYLYTSIDIPVTGKFYGTDSLKMTINFSSEQFGNLFQTETTGIRMK